MYIKYTDKSLQINTSKEKHNHLSMRSLCSSDRIASTVAFRRTNSFAEYFELRWKLSIDAVCFVVVLLAMLISYFTRFNSSYNKQSNGSAYDSTTMTVWSVVWYLPVRLKDVPVPTVGSFPSQDILDDNAHTPLLPTTHNLQDKWYAEVHKIRHSTLKMNMSYLLKLVSHNRIHFLQMLNLLSALFAQLALAVLHMPYLTLQRLNVMSQGLVVLLYTQSAVRCSS